MSKEKTYDEHLQFLREFIKLKLWFCAKWKSENSHESLADIINYRTMIGTYTVFNSGRLSADPFGGHGRERWDKHFGRSLQDLNIYPSFINSGSSYYTARSKVTWHSLVDDIVDLYNPNDIARFEKDAFEVLSPFIEGRVNFDMEDLDFIASTSSIHEQSCFFYDLNSTEEYLHFHVWNNVYPKSIFDDEELFKSNLLKMVLDARRHNFKGIGGNTWLNNCAFWTRLLPPQWKLSATEDSYDIIGSLGVWGQFISSRGTFKSNLANRYRRTHLLPLPMNYCKASLDEFENFLQV